MHGESGRVRMRGDWHSAFWEGGLSLDVESEF